MTHAERIAKQWGATPRERRGRRKAEIHLRGISRMDDIFLRLAAKSDKRPLFVPKNRREAIRLLAYLTKVIAETDSELSYRDRVFPRRPANPATGFIYLMRNRRNGFTKIGFSTAPAVREKTLQSEEPDIEMIFCAPGDIQLERHIHAEFAGRHVRGEWFNLSDSDCDSITSNLSEK